MPGTGPAVAVLSGGNVDPLLLIKLIDHGLSAAGRYLLLRIVLGDQPGALAGLTGAVAKMVGHMGAEAVGYSFILELAFLGGRGRIGDLETFSVMTYE